VYSEIYDNVQQPSHALDVTTTVIGVDGRPVFSTHMATPPSDTAAAPGAKVAFGVQVPLNNLAPGGYVLRVEVRSRIDGTITFRQVPFSVS
jgi:hypothetical protein